MERTKEKYDRRLLVKFTARQWTQVQALIDHEGHCPAGTYVRQMLLARAAALLPGTTTVAAPPSDEADEMDSRS